MCACFLGNYMRSTFRTITISAASVGLELILLIFLINYPVLITLSLAHLCR